MVKIVNLRTGYEGTPLGIDSFPPRFSWNLEDGGKGRRQTGYRILVGSSEAILHSGKGDLWDSGKTNSTETTFIPYGGRRMNSGERAYWMVHIWDEAGEESWSETAWFEMGLLEPSDWQGVFVSAPFCGTGGRGYHSDVFPADKGADFWVQVDLGETREFDRIVIYPCNYLEQGQYGKGFGFPVRFRIEKSKMPGFKKPDLLFEAGEDLPNPGLKPFEIRTPKGTAGRFVRLNVTKPFVVPGNSVALLALDEIQIFSRGVNIALGKSANCANSIKSQIRAGQYDWHIDCLTDGYIHLEEPRHDQGKGNLLRRILHISKPPTRARAYIAARGYYELRINGKKAGDAQLDSPWTVWQKRLLYTTYEITELLRVRDNVITVLLGNGWQLDPAFILRIDIEHADGSRTNLSSDSEWKLIRSPLVSNHIYHGEVYDAALENEEIFKPSFNDSLCDFAPVIDYRPKLSAQMNPPIRIIESIRPVSLSQPKPGVWVFDLGQNIAGWAQVRVKGRPGQKISLRFAELIFDDGSVWTDAEQMLARKEGRLNVRDGMLNNANYRTARAKDEYICKGTGKEEVWEPRFTYHGFRFVELTGYNGTPTLDTVLGKVVHTDVRSIGRFECSDSVMNWTQDALRWSLRTNLHSIPTDCPDRDERQGWMGDGHIKCEAYLFNFDTASFFVKWLRDMRDSQRTDGAICDTTPPTLGRFGGDISWGSAIVLVAWYVYLWTGDRLILEEFFDAMKRFVEFFANACSDRIVDDTLYNGDWLAIEPTPHQLVNTGYFYWSARILADCSTILGMTDESRRFSRLSDEISAAFQSRFFDSNSCRYGNGSQFSNGWPLYLGIVPDKLRKGVFENIVQDIEKHRGHLTTGFLGTKYMMELLCDMGRADLAYAIAQTSEYPGWGYMKEHGATTIWEHWSLKTGNDMNSHNLPTFGAVGAWFMKYVAGIRPDAAHPGFKHVIFSPEFTPRLNYANGDVETVRGKVSSSWRRDKGGIRLEVSVPVGSTGSVILKDVAEVHGDSGIMLQEGNKTILRHGAGNYRFLITEKK